MDESDESVEVGGFPAGNNSFIFLESVETCNNI